MEDGTYITALRTEEMTNMPLATTSNHDLSLDRCLAAPASRAEEFVKVQMAVEPQ